MDSDVSPTDQVAPVPSDLSPAAASVNASAMAEFSAQTVEASPQPQDLESFNPIEPPPLDWRSDSSSDAGCANNLEDPGFLPSIEHLEEPSVIEPVLESLNPVDTIEQEVSSNFALLVHDFKEEVVEEVEVEPIVMNADWNSTGECQEEVVGGDQNCRTSVRDDECAKGKSGDEDHSSIHSLLSQLQLIGEEPLPIQPLPPQTVHHQLPESLLADNSTETTGLLFSESHHRDLLGLLQFTDLSSASQPTSSSGREEVDAIVAVSYSQEDAQRLWAHRENEQQQHRDSITSLSDDEYPEPVWKKRGEEPPKEDEAAAETEQVG